MKSPTASNWTSPKSKLRTPRRSTRGKLGANESGPQPGRLRLLGSQILLACGIGGIGHSNSVLIATAHISLTECPLGPHQRRKSGHAGRVAARTRLGSAKWDPDRGSRSGVRQEVFLDVVAVDLEQQAGAAAGVGRHHFAGGNHLEALFCA